MMSTPCRCTLVCMVFSLWTLGCDDQETDETAGAGTFMEDAGAAGGIAAYPDPAEDDYEPEHPPPNYETMAHWVCHPEKMDGPCRENLDLSQVEVDGRVEVVPFVAAQEPQFDCFYVYPTISMDPSKNSDLEIGAEAFATRMQAARLLSVCRVFAPLYRQSTITNLLLTPKPEHKRVAYRDVLEAFDHYMETQNAGRDMILIGHSQGAEILSQVLSDRFEGFPEMRARLVTAYLPGTAMPALAGAEAGTVHPNIPICRRDDQRGCLISYASYRAAQPPVAGARYGSVPDGERVAICNNPAGLAGGLVNLDGVFPTEIPSVVRGFVNGNVSPFADPDAHPPLTTPFFSMPGAFSGECVDNGEFQYLEITTHVDPEDPRADEFGGDIILPGAGLHLLDINLVSADILALIRSHSPGLRTQ